MSQQIALAMHYYLRTTGTTQKEFAENMGVSAAYLGKLLKGNENLTLETICKIQHVMGNAIVCIAKPYEAITTVSFTPSYRESEKVATSAKYSSDKAVCEQYVALIATA